jgi:hypothetical protein
LIGIDPTCQGAHDASTQQRYWRISLLNYSYKKS